MRVPERGIHLVFVSKGEQDNKLTPETGKKKKKKNNQKQNMSWWVPLQHRSDEQ